MGNKGNETMKKNNKNNSELVNKESFCAVGILFSLLALLMLFTKSSIFGSLGETIHIFLTGMLGYFAYPTFLGIFYLSVTGLVGKRFVKERKIATLGSIAVVFLLLIIHIVQTVFIYDWALEGYLDNCFNAGENFPKTTLLGWIGGLIVFGAIKLLSTTGAIVVFFLFCALFSYLTATLILKKFGAPIQKEKVKKEKIAKFGLFSGAKKSTNNEPITQSGGNGYSPFGISQGMTEKEIYASNLINDPTARVNNLPPMEQVSSPIGSFAEREAAASYATYTSAYEDAINEDEEQPSLKINSEPFASNTDWRQEETRPMPMEPIEENPFSSQEEVDYPTFISSQQEESEESFERENRFGIERESSEVLQTPETNEESGYRRHDYMNVFSMDNPNVFGRQDENVESNIIVDRNRETDMPFDQEYTSDESFVNESEERRDGLTLFDEEPKENPYELRSDFTETREERTVSDDRGFSTSRIEDREEQLLDSGRSENVSPFGFGTQENERETFMQEPIAAPQPKPKKPHVPKPYKRISLDDLDCRDVEPTSNSEDIERTKETILATLEDFKVSNSSIASVTFGPTVTRYNVTIPRSIPPKKIIALDQSIAINLYTEGVNIYPNYEDGAVSVEVPNKERQFVQLGCMLSGDTYVNAKSTSLMFAMGKDVANRKIYGDISKMIHLLVAGASGSGKSVFLGSLIISLIHKYSPEELRLILIDPKKTEFMLYNNLPHLMVNEIITEVDKAVQSLEWAIIEMNRRYELFRVMTETKTYVVNLDQYNAQVDKLERLPKIVIIIDELADLILSAKKDIEDKIQNLTQKARAAGIHLVVATQRPSTDVITGVIKSNLPTRIAFGVASDVDSRVILDQSGAQKLLGKGDLLYTTQGVKFPIRVQSAFISTEESQKVVNYIKANNEAYYDEEISEFINKKSSASGGGASKMDKDNVEPVYIESLRYAIEMGSASISMVQRKCSVGFQKAGKIIEWMESMGYISSYDGARARKVLISPEEFEKIYGKF